VESARDPSTRPPARAILLFIMLGITAALCAIALWRGWVRPEIIQSLVQRSGPAAMAVYIAAVVVLELFWMPRMWGLVAGGALFGPVVGGALSIAADMASALLCYFLARGAAREWAASLLARRKKADQIVRLLAEKRGAAMIALLRVCPIAHYTLVNYGAGVAGVRPSAFILGTAVGLLPGAVLYPILGDSLFRPGSAVFIVTASVVVVAMVVTFIIGRRMIRL
jgi:uncharacterized membrane protein YdjX (TVP38/TMEM64 family)